MDISKTVASQFNAALSMMEQTVSSCPEDLWNVPGQANPFWRVAYHALFYVDLYMQPSEDEMKLWEDARDGYQFLGPTPWPPHEQPQADQPYSPEEILAYIEHLRSFVASTVPSVDLSAPSGFHLAAVRQAGTADLQYPPSATAHRRPEHDLADAGES